MSANEKYSFLNWVALEPGTWADWFSGTMSALAVTVALAGYWIVERQRKLDERQRRQNAAYQIGFKIATLASEAKLILSDLNPQNLSDDELATQNPMQTCGMLAPKIGFEDTIARDLSETEQNLLMFLKEEDFLMDFSEAFARNLSLRAGLLEYKTRHEAISTLLPTPVQVAGEVVSFDLSQEQLLSIQPYVVPAASLVRSMRGLAKVNVDMIEGLTNSFRPMMSKHFPDLHVHQIVTQENKEAQV